MSFVRSRSPKISLVKRLLDRPRIVPLRHIIKRRKEEVEKEVLFNKTRFLCKRKLKAKFSVVIN
jgi:electron transfer flavoprotein alpha/beta subunit